MSGSIETNSGRKSGTIGAKVAGPTISASDPSTSTNAELGTQWANSTSGEFYILTDATTDANVWTNVGSGSGDIGFLWGGTRGIVAGGYSAVVTIDYITIASTGNATDFGDLSFGRRWSGTCSNVTRGVFACGNTDWSTYFNSIDYITVASTGNATDMGDLNITGTSLGGVSDGSRGVFGMNYNGSGVTNVMDYITIATHSGTATDFGDLTQARYGGASFNDVTRGVFSGGSPTGGATNTIDYITIQSTGNATDFGDLTGSARYYAFIGGACDTTRGLTAGGDSGSGNVDEIDYTTIATTGNSSDFGNLQSAKSGGGCGSSGVRAFFGGSSAGTNETDFVTIQTTGNATDFGNLSTSPQASFGTAGG